MKPTLNIQTNNFDYSNAQLFVEIAPQQVSIFVLDTNHCFNNFISYYLSADISQSENALQDIFNDSFFNNIYKNVTVIYTLPESILTPTTLMKEEYNHRMLSLIFGHCNGCIHKFDLVQGQEIYNVYRIPASLSKIITEKFPSCTEHHQFSLLQNPDEAHTTILCIFYNSGCSIRLQKGHEIILANYFAFATPTDVVYYLLSICKHFTIEVQQVHLVLAGLIEKDSILYKEIYKFFLEIYFLKPSIKYTCHEAFNNYPQHYFNHLFQMAECV